MDRQRRARRIAHHGREVRGWDAGDVELAALEHEPRELGIDPELLHDPVEVRALGIVIAGVARQHDALATAPLAEHEGPAPNRLRREVVAELPRALGRHDRREEERELVEEERIGLGELDLDDTRLGRPQPGDVRRAAVDERRRADDAAEILRTLRARPRLEHALDRADGIARRERCAVGEDRLRAEREAIAPAVRRHFPAVCQRRHERRPVVVRDERLEEVLLEEPRARVVPERGVERRHVVRRGQAQYPAPPRTGLALRPLEPVACAPAEEHDARDSDRRADVPERRVHATPSRRRPHAPGARPSPASPYAMKLNVSTAYSTAAPGNSISHGATR